MFSSMSYIGRRHRGYQLYLLSHTSQVVYQIAKFPSWRGEDHLHQVFFFSIKRLHSKITLDMDYFYVSARPKIEFQDDSGSLSCESRACRLQNCCVPLFFSQWGMPPRDSVSADVFLFPGIQSTLILHLNLYFWSSQQARKLLPILFDERPFFNQVTELVLSENKCTIRPATLFRKQKIETKAANNSLRAIVRFLKHFNSLQEYKKYSRPQSPPIPYSVEASTNTGWEQHGSFPKTWLKETPRLSIRIFS